MVIIINLILQTSDIIIHPDQWMCRVHDFITCRGLHLNYKVFPIDSCTFAQVTGMTNCFCTDIEALVKREGFFGGVV